MKKLSILLFATVVTTLSLNAQEQQTAGESSISPKFGIKAGLNLSNLYVDEVEDENMKAGLNAGFYAKLPITRGFSLQPELIYSNKGAKLRYDNFVLGEGEYRFNLHYVELPIMGVINVLPNFNIHAGPYLSFLAGADIKDMNDDGSIDNVRDLNADNFNRFDVGVSAGLGFDIQNITLGARYNYGLSEIGKSGSLSGQLTRDAKNSAISVYIGFGF